MSYYFQWCENDTWRCNCPYVFMDSFKIKAINYERQRHLDNKNKHIHQAKSGKGKSEIASTCKRKLLMFILIYYLKIILKKPNHKIMEKERVFLWDDYAKLDCVSEPLHQLVLLLDLISDCTTSQKFTPCIRKCRV